MNGRWLALGTVAALAAAQGVRQARRRGGRNGFAWWDAWPQEGPEVGTRTFWHGTSVANARKILAQGWDRQRFGDRQRALRGGVDAPEVRGVYVTDNLAYAQSFYGSPDEDLRKPGRGGGAVVEVQVTGPLIGPTPWWQLRRQAEDELVARGQEPLRMYDPRKQWTIDRAVRLAQARGYVGFAEAPRNGEFVVFDPADARVVGARGPDGQKLLPRSRAA